MIKHSSISMLNSKKSGEKLRLTKVQQLLLNLKTLWRNLAAAEALKMKNLTTLFLPEVGVNSKRKIQMGPAYTRPNQ